MASKHFYFIKQTNRLIDLTHIRGMHYEKPSFFSNTHKIFIKFEDPRRHNSYLEFIYLHYDIEKECMDEFNNIQRRQINIANEKE